MVLAILLILFYLASHLLNLTALPIFADEAIYIRWTQLMMDDFGRYFLFPLNDGKTPLFMWLMLPFQYLFSDQLFAGRFVGVLVGLAQILVSGYLILKLGGRKKTAILAMLFTSILPFWYFHHRMALIDGLLTLWLSTCLIGLLDITQYFELKKKVVFSKSTLLPVLIFGVSFGLALLTKMTALVFVPIFGLFVLYPAKINLKTRLQIAMSIGMGVVLGFGIFGLLSFFPGFGQLFKRGSDFLYPVSEVFLNGEWQDTIPNIPTYIYYFISYMTLPVFVLHLWSLFLPKHRRTFHLLFWAGLLFVLPIAVLGRVVYPRYLLPGAIFMTLSATLAIQEIVDTWISGSKKLWKKSLFALLFILFLTNTLSHSGLFIINSHLDPDSIPFVSADRTQYLTEWSSGHGITQTIEFIQSEAEKYPVAVATEGFFGTLPDALNVYLHRQNVTNIYVEGIGQPVSQIPETFTSRAQEYEKVYLVVNSHRLILELPKEALVEEHCRPFNAPCLQIWDITALTL